MFFGSMLPRLAVLILTLVQYGNAQSYFIAAPNVFRVGVDETVFVSFAQQKRLELSVQDSRSSKVVFHVVKNFKPGKPEIVTIKIKESDLPKSWASEKQHYKLVAKTPGLHKETPILLHIRGSTVFIQTDKPIYSPDEKVKYRIIPVDLNLRPLKRNVTVEIRNPQGALVQRERNLQAFQKGFHVGDFSLGHIPVLGTWTITAIFGVKNARNTSSTFVVKKYVLPTFKVRIHPPAYIVQRAEPTHFFIKVTAKYSFGKYVKGIARLRIFVGKKDILIDDQRTLINGEQIFKINHEKLLQPKEISKLPFGERLKVIAEVTERSTGTKEQAIDQSIKIVETPFSLSFDKTAKYFKPGINLNVGVSVRYPNNKPVEDEELKYEYSYDGKTGKEEGSANTVKTNNDGEAFFTINTPSDNKPIKIKVETKSGEFVNAMAEMIVEPYRSTKGNYIVIRTHQPGQSATGAKIGNTIAVEFLVFAKNGKFVKEINYLVVAKGRIVHNGFIRRKTEVTSTMQLKIKPSMAPKCRIIAFYVKDGETTSDSILLDVEDKYENKVLIEATTSRDQFRPTLPIYMNIKTEGKSLVGLMAVDQSVYYLRNESRLTNKKVFQEIGSFDLGCGLGSGKDNQDVFEKAGLAVISDTVLATRPRKDLSCSSTPKSRKRRSVKPAPLLAKCCKGDCCRNFYNTRARLSLKAKCADLQPRLEKSCWKDFLVCCKNMFEIRGRLAGGEDDFNGKDQVSIIDESQINLRDDFPQSWMWFDFETSEDGISDKDYTLPDSITTWEITALAINNKTGFGLSNTLKVKSSLDLFVYIKMPYSAQRYEQITVYAVIYNFNPTKTWAKLYLKWHESFCSIADEKTGRSPIIDVLVEANDAASIPFTLIPLHIGELPVEISVSTINGGDRIQKKLIVVPEGIQTQESSSYLLDPQGIKQGSKKLDRGSFEQRKASSQVNSKNLLLPASFVPDSQRAMVYVTGSLMSAGIQDIIEKGLDKLIQMPTGCGEQTMIRLAPLVYVLRYLYSIKNGVTAAVEKKAYGFMRKGYNNELNYRRSDNSYSVWGSRTPPSTWLTAFVNKVFCQATHYIKDDIDNNVICDTLKFLEKIQEADGSFPEGYAVRHREMIGGVTSKLSLTSFVLISLMECNSHCINSDSRVIMKASQFLADQISSIRSGYVMSLVSYALVIANHPKKMIAFNKLNAMLTRETSDGRERKYINDGGSALQVESTAYTLLTMAALNQLDQAGPIVIWLTEKRNSRGAFYSTQDTVIALQALSEYCSKTAGGELDLEVTISSTKKNIRKKFLVSNENALVRQEVEITDAIPGLITFDTVGKGTAQLQVELMYNRPQVKNKDCEYEIAVRTVERKITVLNDSIKPKKWKEDAKIKQSVEKKLKKCKRKCKGKCKKIKKCRRGCVKKCKKRIQPKEQSDQVTNRILIEICIRHKFTNGSSMTMVEVGLLTGFKPDEDSLKNLATGNRDPRMNNYEVNDRFVVLYMEKVSQVKSCFSFATVRDFDVGMLQAVPVIVYDYYEPNKKCTTFYSPNKESELLKTICDGDECICSQGVCSEERSVDPREIKNWACSKSQFVLVGEVRDIEPENSLMKIALRIAKVYKKGKKDFAEGFKLHVYQPSSCRTPKLTLGGKILLMFKEKPLYLLDKDAFVLNWPKNAKKVTELESALEDVKLGHYCG